MSQPTAAKENLCALDGKSASSWPAAFVCRLLFYVEYNKKPALSANSCSETSNLDTASFSIIIFIKNRGEQGYAEFLKQLKQLVLSLRMLLR